MAGAAAKRYARAIFEVAQEEGEVEAWAERLERVDRSALVRLGVCPRLDRGRQS